jgi:hypothetical protein
MPCPINGGWSNWSDYGDCVDNVKSRTRTCDNPSPEYDGTVCGGDAFDTQPCTTSPGETGPEDKSPGETGPEDKSPGETGPENKYTNYVIYAIAFLFVLIMAYLGMRKSTEKVAGPLYQVPYNDQVYPQRT